MNRIVKVGLLCVIAIAQGLTLVWGFDAGEQVVEDMTRLKLNLKALEEEITPGLKVDYGLDRNPFTPLVPLGLLGLFLTAALLVDQLTDENGR